MESARPPVLPALLVLALALHQSFSKATFPPRAEVVALALIFEGSFHLVHHHAAYWILSPLYVLFISPPLWEGFSYIITSPVPFVKLGFAALPEPLW